MINTNPKLTSNSESALQTQAELGQYPTPFWVAEALVQRHFSYLDHQDCVIDHSCGPGSFLAAIPAHVPAYGVEIDRRLAALARMNTGRHIIEGDFRTVELDVRPTAIIGNPPFNLKLIDGFLERSHTLLPEGGRVGMILPSYAFQTAGRVAAYSDKWSLFQEMLPRNIYHGLSKPLIFAIFSKDQRKVMVGFALYRETADMQQLSQRYREIMSGVGRSVWLNVVAEAMLRLGGKASLEGLYAEIEGRRPTRTKWWREQIRKVTRTHKNVFRQECDGRYSFAT